jgi:hypothetical protein
MSLCLVSLTESRYVECHYTECHYAEYCYAVCHYTECHYAECRYAECFYDKCRGALLELGLCSLGPNLKDDCEKIFEKPQLEF